MLKKIIKRLFDFFYPDWYEETDFVWTINNSEPVKIESQKLEFKIEKVDFWSIAPIEREKFLRLIYWYYILKITDAVSQQTSELRNEFLIRANEIMTFYNSIKTIHDMDINWKQKVIEELAKQTEWPKATVLTKPEKELTKEELKQKIEMEAKVSIL